MSDADVEARGSRARQAADPDPEVGGIAADRLRSIILAERSRQIRMRDRVESIVRTFS